MTLTVRTDPRVSEALAQYCAQEGQTKSDVVKLALAEFWRSRRCLSQARGIWSRI
jgi:hypothetical protein